MQWCQRLKADYGMDPWIRQSLDRREKLHAVSEFQHGKGKHIQNKVYYHKIKKLEVYYMSGSKKKNITATILEKVARNSVKAAADSRCMYCLHQPKQPTGIKKFCR